MTKNSRTLLSLKSKSNDGVRGFLMAGKEDLLKHDEEGKQHYREAITELQNTVVTEQGKRLLADIVHDYEGYRAIADQEIQLKRANKSAEAISLGFSPQMSSVRSDLRKSVADFIEFQEGLRQETIKKQKSTQSTANLIVASLALGGIARVHSRPVHRPFDHNRTDRDACNDSGCRSE
jgi:CHASE3 domain sensor protein